MKVLLPIDDSDCFGSVIDALVTRTWPKNVQFRIVTVIPYQQPGYFLARTEKTQDMLNEYGQKMIDGMVTELKKTIQHTQISGKILIGDAVSSIAQEAEEWRSDLIVMGSHERKGFLKFIFGSTAAAVCKKVTCKVEIIKQPDWLPDPDF